MQRIIHTEEEVARMKTVLNWLRRDIAHMQIPLVITAFHGADNSLDFSLFLNKAV